MTDDREAALIDSAVAGLNEDLRDAYRELLSAIDSGTPPRDAVQAAVSSFQGDMAETLAVAFSAILETGVGSRAVLQLEVAGVTLSRRLYQEAANVSAEVGDIVRRHTQGLLDARRLALDLFEGYSFRDTAAEPLQFNARNPRLPQYLREALLTDDDVRATMARAFARLQVDNLTTAALRAAYAAVLDAIGGIEAAEGRALLEKRLEVAFFERMRYFASRIARTELHRAYSDREAALLMADVDVEFVQVRRAPGRGTDCICVLLTGRDLYGMGPGVYPKAAAPRPPFHPFCMCVMSPRLDLTGRNAGERDPDGSVYFLRRLGETTSARIMGSADKRDAVLKGSSPEAVVNAGKDPMYRVRTVGG